MAQPLKKKEIKAFNIKDFDTFLDNISLIAGYKVAL
jgi:hypothetical protein